MIILLQWFLAFAKNIDTNEYFDTIQSAIDAADPGNIITVAPDILRELGH